MSKIASLVKLAVTYVFDPTGAGVTASHQAIEKIVGWLGADDRERYDALIERARKRLESLVEAKEVKPEDVEPAATTAEVLLTRHGLNAAALTALNLKPDDAANAVFERGAGVLGTLGTAEASCRRFVQTFYEALLDDPAILQEMEGAFRRTLLARLSEIENLVGEIAQAMRAIAGGALLANPARAWLPDRFPPSALLRAEYQIVPFHGREELCEEIEAWCRSDAPVGIQVYAGPGGTGKTRLFIELCRRMGRNPWRTGFLDREAAEAPPWLMDHLVEGAQNTLIVVDYAETRRAELVPLLRRAARTPSGRRLRLHFARPPSRRLVVGSGGRRRWCWRPRNRSRGKPICRAAAHGAAAGII